MSFQEWFNSWRFTDPRGGCLKKIQGSLMIPKSRLIEMLSAAYEAGKLAAKTMECEN